MIYTAEISGLGLVVAIVWYLASTFLNDFKKSKNKVGAEDSKSIFDFTTLKAKLLEISKSNLDISNEVVDKIENEEKSQEPFNNALSNEVDLDQKENKNNDKFSSKEVNISNEKIDQPSLNILKILKNKNEFHKAILLKEILDKPKALRK
tara:strand:+ start:17 stop:466 length:450 start_codon:yes stop_codon:yes gene_type:complete